MSVSLTGQIPTTPAVLSPSTLARHFFHDCSRFLAFRTLPSDTRKRLGSPNRPFDTSAAMQALQHRGAAWEEVVVAEYLKGVVTIADGSNSLSDRYHDVAA